MMKSETGQSEIYQSFYKYLNRVNERKWL